MDSKELLNQLYENRVVIMVEKSPQSNVYAQLILTKDQWIKINNAILTSMPPCTIPGHMHAPDQKCVMVTFDDDIKCTLPDTAKTYYSVEEIAKIEPLK